MDLSELAPDMTFELPESWYRQTISSLQDKLAVNGLEGALLGNVLNIQYFTGLLFTDTERPFWLFVPVDDEPILFHPALDQALVDTWWIKENEWYFDYPNQSRFNRKDFSPASRREVEELVLDRLIADGYGESSLGIDSAAGQSLPCVFRDSPIGFEQIGQLCLRMRQLKTDEEIELIKSVAQLEGKMLEFARELILEHAPGILDFEVKRETENRTVEALAQHLELDGAAHQGRGIDVQFTCRAGQSTAYPHPNQFFYHEIEPGDSIQLACFVHLGGYCAEGYRALQIEPATKLQRKTWKVHTDMVNLLPELVRHGASCSDVAEEVFLLAEQAGLGDYVYHRPGHGVGMEGHQPPYVHVGEEAELQEGMVISDEPGLYNPEEGWGYNHSNTVLVSEQRGEVLNPTPLSREWCWLRL